MKKLILLGVVALPLIGCADKITKTTTTYRESSASAPAPASVTVAPGEPSVVVTDPTTGTTSTTRRKVVETEVE